MWLYLKSAVILTAITVGAAFAVLPPDGWRVPEPAVVEAASQVGAGVVVNGQTVHLVWLDMQERELYYKRSSDAGFQWTGKVRISDVQDEVIPTALDITIASDRDQWVYVAWTQYEPQVGQNRVWFSYSDDNGITWTAPEPITSPYAPMSPQPVLGCDARGWAHLVYVGAEGTNPRIEGLIYKWFDNVTRSWSQPGLVCEEATSPKIALLGNEPHIVTRYAGGTCFRHSRLVSGQWETSVIPETDDHLHHSFVIESSTGYLQLTAIRQTAPYRLRQFRSTDNGNTWLMSDLAEITDPYPGPSLVSDRAGLFISYSSGIPGEGRNLFQFYSSDHGSSWTGPHPLTQLSGDETSCAVASGRFGRVLAFDYNLPSEDVWVTADDDSLLSDSPEATAFSSGRHLVRDYMNSRLHLVYFSQNRPHYTYSDDEGSTWAPYHIMDNIAQSSKDRGKFPSVGLYASPSETFEPCMAYVSPASTGDTLKYRWWNPATSTWEGFWLCNAGISLGAPSLTTFGEMIGVVVVAKNPALGQYVVCYYEFPYYAAGPGTPEIVQSGFQDVYASPCITVDGNWDKHAVYEENGEIVYERRVGPNTWVRDPPFPPSPLLCSVTPFIEFYGDKLYVPYAEEDQPLGFYDVYRRWRNLYQPPIYWSDPPDYVSSSFGIPSQCPVAAWGDFTVWAEQGPGDIEFDIKYYWHPEYQSGFVWVYPLHSDHLHTQMYYDWLGGSAVLLTAWTEGLMTAAPYRIASQKISFLPPPGDFGTYYAVRTGNATPSFFCSKRDSFIRYQRYNVDFGKDELVYTLTLLNPTYPAYRVKALSYFEGTGNRIAKVLIDGKEYATLDLKPNQLNTSELLIPKEYYKGDHKAVLTFRGSPVTKAGLVVQQLEQAKVGAYSGGGVQSVSTEKLFTGDIFTVSPNPARGLVAITYALVHHGDVRLRLYDASGRMIQELAHGSTSAGTHQVALKQGLPAGVYFVTLEIDGNRIIRKVTIVR